MEFIWKWIGQKSDKIWKMVKNRVNGNVEEQPLHDSLLELLHVKIKRVGDWNKEKNISIERSCLLLYATNGIWHKPIRSNELILECNQWKCKRRQECGKNKLIISKKKLVHSYNSIGMGCGIHMQNLNDGIFFIIVFLIH